MKDFNMASALKRLFSPALDILLKWLEMGVQLIMQVNYSNNIHKILTY